MLSDINQKILLSIEKILEYHKIAMRDNINIAGKIRNISVHIKGNPNFKVEPPEKIKKQLNKLLDKYNKFIKNKTTTIREIINFASFFHNEFQHIHPFIDGNSRITRLITFHLLQSKDMPIFDIPFGLLDEYLSFTKGSFKRNDENLFENLQKIILYNLKKINEGLEV